MIDPAFVRMMAVYNAEMNRRLLGAATRLRDVERRRDRGAFWKSIHGTLSHLLWADRMWMSRLDGWTKPDVPLKASAEYVADFGALSAARPEADARIIAWADRITPAELAADLVWFSGAAGREISMPRAEVVVHFFNHQTHHRGQVHAMLTASGEATGDTDLFLVVPETEYHR